MKLISGNQFLHSARLLIHEAFVPSLNIYDYFQRG